MGKNIILKGVIIFSVLALLSILFSGAFLFIFVKFTERNPSESSHQYRFTEVSPFSKKVRKGFVTIPQSLEPEEYISYLNEETGSSVVITNSGGTDYECSGACFCDESRRAAAASGQLLTRGLVVLFTAFSSTMAIKLAKDTFHDQCLQHFSDVCGSSHVLSEVDDCKEKEEEVTKVEGEENISSEDQSSKKEHFLCNGYCVSLAEIDDDIFNTLIPGFGKGEYQSVGMEHVGLCEAKKLEKVISLDLDDLRTQLMEAQLPGFPPMSKLPEAETLARVEFGTNDLTEYCESTSRLRKEWFSDANREQLEKFYVEAKNAPIGMRAVHPLMQRGISEDKGLSFCFGFSFGSGVRKFSGSEEKQSGITVNNLDCVRFDQNAN